MTTASQAVIVGAGPAGAALAYLLARRGIEVVLLERQTDFAREFRGEGLMPSGLDAFAQMGLEARLAAVPQTQIEAVEFYRGAKRLSRIEISADLFGASGPHIVSQPAMLEMLVAEASRYPGFRLERGVVARELVVDQGRVTGVRGDTRTGPLECHADFVIGADGRASVIRKRAGLHEERTPQAFDLVWGKVPLPGFLADRRTARAYFGKRHAALFFPSYDGRLQFGWAIEKGSFGELRRRGIDEWIDELAAYLSPDLALHLRAHRADVAHPFLLDVICDRLTKWTAPGLLLLGDASHPMSPVGGQGINIALRDALVAANHLCPALLQRQSAAELDAAAGRVQAERMPEVTAVQRMQQVGPWLLFAGKWLSTIALSPPVLSLLRFQPLQQRIIREVRRLAAGVTQVKLEV